MIDQTQTTLDVAIYSLTHPDIVSALQRAAKRGVKVRIIADRSQSEGKAMTEALKILGSISIHIKVNTHSGLMHLKVVIADQQVTTTGSFNFSKAVATINDEVLLVIKNPDVAKSFAAEFESMWQDTKRFASISPKIASAGSVPAAPAAGSETLSGSCSTKTIT